MEDEESLNKLGSCPLKWRKTSLEERRRMTNEEETIPGK